MELSLFARLLSTEVPPVLFHCTSSAGLLGILDSGKIWATKIHYLNDNSELLLAYSKIRDEIRRRQNVTEDDLVKEQFDDMLQGLTSSEPTNIAVASFSEIGDQLSQWRGYCEVGKGYSLGFDGPKLKQIFMDSNYDLALVYMMQRIKNS